jgi:hypothetical protein
VIFRVLALLAIPFWVGAAVPTPTVAVKPCGAPEHRQFDFWIGEWEVRYPDGKLAGENRIERILSGCALRESWTGARGSRGTSLNAYDPGTKRWHQTWVDGDGLLLQIDGGIRGGAMVLEGETLSSAGRRTRQRTTWTPLPGGRVRQLWQQSTDDGKNWTVVFDGTYARKRGR